MLTQEFELALVSKIGEGGLPDAAFEQALTDLEPALAKLREQARDRSLPLLGLPADTSDLPGIRQAAERLKSGGATDILILGTGGSSLGGQTLAQLTDYGISGLSQFLPEPRVHFIDNLDPDSYQRLLAKLPLETTKFVAISKSGGTGETLLQSMGCDLRAEGSRI